MSEWKAQNLYLDATITHGNSQFWTSKDRLDRWSKVADSLAVIVFYDLLKEVINE